MPKEVTVAGVTVDPLTKSPIVVLREPESGNVVPIWIGLLEANAIALALEGT
jgi:bifunctional DNase/RNase